VAYDYDQTIYCIRKLDEDPVVKFGFTCNGSKVILSNGGDQMLNDIYKGKDVSLTRLKNTCFLKISG
jgi:hypothetical protein